jgi:uroporphyrin-III C-methyltransferase/precorrin-2 dehydrogenase/sirohydrochlorin ferrochelatase
VDYLPLFIDLRDRPVLVVGGGPVAERKVGLLREAGARVTVVAPKLTPFMARAATDGEIAHLARSFAPEQVSGARLVIAATGERAVNHAVAAAAEAHGVWVNVVDDAAGSSCIVPAIVDRTPLLIAISSGGAAPMLSRSVRARLEAQLDESIGRLALLCARWRTRILESLPKPNARRRFYDALLSGAVPDLVRARRDTEADASLQTALEEWAAGASGPSGSGPGGKVVLVGAGPGDPGLLTLHALRALQQADVIVHDRLVSTGVLALARRDAERISVGKQAGGPSATQEEINALLAEHARAGRHVVRLKGGDPFIFGRGGEELEFLRERCVRCEVIPGITAAVASAAYAGIPLTHRDHAHSVRFLTGHSAASHRDDNWLALGRADETLAIYMGVAELPALVQQLIRAGRAASTPVALIENASRAGQRVFRGELAQVADLAAHHGVGSPSLLLVGAVTRLADTLHWFGSAPVVPAPELAAPEQFQTALPA